MSDIQEEMLIIKKKAKANDMKVKFIGKTWADALNNKEENDIKERKYAGVNVVVNKELYDEYKGTLQEQIEELQNRINKAVEDLEKTKELNDKHILARDNIVVHLDIDHIEYLLNILKGDNK